jgi:hypothetical protein
MIDHSLPPSIDQLATFLLVLCLSLTGTHLILSALKRIAFKCSRILKGDDN